MNQTEVLSRYAKLLPSTPMYYSWPDGWHSLVETACEAAAPFPPGLVTYSCIKQATAVLHVDRRMPWRPGDSASWVPGVSILDELLRDVMRRSKTICERCGEPGKKRSDLPLDWWHVLCDFHDRTYRADYKRYMASGGCRGECVS